MPSNNVTASPTFITGNQFNQYSLTSDQQPSNSSAASQPSETQNCSSSPPSLNTSAINPNVTLVAAQSVVSSVSVPSLPNNIQVTTSNGSQLPIENLTTRMLATSNFGFITASSNEQLGLTRPIMVLNGTSVAIPTINAVPISTFAIQPSLQELDKAPSTSFDRSNLPVYRTIMQVEKQTCNQLAANKIVPSNENANSSNKNSDTDNLHIACAIRNSKDGIMNYIAQGNSEKEVEENIAQPIGSETNDNYVDQFDLISKLVSEVEICKCEPSECQCDGNGCCAGCPGLAELCCPDLKSLEKVSYIDYPMLENPEIMPDPLDCNSFIPNIVSSDKPDGASDSNEPNLPAIATSGSEYTSFQLMDFFVASPASRGSSFDSRTSEAPISQVMEQ